MPKTKRAILILEIVTVITSLSIVEAWSQSKQVLHVTTEEISPGIYKSKSPEGKPITLMKLKTNPQNLASSWDTSPAFENIKHSFVGNMYEYVRARSSDGHSKIIAAVHVNYNPEAQKHPSLSTAGIVQLNEKGIVEGKNAKSGWVKIPTWGSYTNASTGEIVKIELNVSFWINEGGKNWLSFMINKASLRAKQKVNNIWLQMEQLARRINQPVILIDGKYKLVPNIHSLGDITFVEERSLSENTKNE